MQFLIILLCALLACSKATTQGGLVKGNVKNISDSTLMVCLIFVAISIIFLPSMAGGFDPMVLLYAAALGILSTSLQMSYSLAMKCGPFSLSCLICNLGKVIPIVYSVIFFGEKLTVLKVTGILLCGAALVLSMGKDDKKINTKWIICIFITFLSNGFIATVQKIFTKAGYKDSIGQFLFFGYFIAFVLCLIIFSFLKNTNKEEVNFKINRKTIIPIIGVTVFLGAYQYAFTYANSVIDAIVLVPSVNGLATMFQMLAGKILFKEKFTRKQIASFCVGVVAIVLMSI